jgi:phosphoribosylglycinamide formyltransferase-1
MVRTAIFCSGKGSHLQTIAIAKDIGIKIEPIFFFSDNTDAPCYEKAMDMWPSIEARAMRPSLFTNREEYDKEIRNIMDPYNIELILFLGYMRIVSPIFLKDAPPIINIHPSLLPSFKGKDAIQQALDYGVIYTGATAHYVNEELDGGPIISQQVIKIEKEMTYDRLKTWLFLAEQSVLIEALQIHLGDKPWNQLKSFF